MKMIIALFLSILSLSGCSWNANDEIAQTEPLVIKNLWEEENNMEKSIFEKMNVNSDVTLTIKETPISNPLPEFLTLVYTNHSDTEYFYGEHFRVEKKVDDIWYTFPASPAIDIAYSLEANATGEIKCNILDLHETMDSGMYRILCFVRKRVESDNQLNTDTDDIVTYEFSVDETHEREETKIRSK